MYKLRHYIDVTANGANQDWAVLYATNAWEAVGRSSADTDYIQSATLGERSDFTCGTGPAPRQGIVSAVTVHYRARTTDTTGAPAFLIDLTREGAQLTSGQTVGGLPTPPGGGWEGPIPPGGTPAPGSVGTGWVDGEYRVSIDPDTRIRFAADGLYDLGCMVEVTTAPTTGYLQIAALWLEVEWGRSADRYDPAYFSDTPDAITGDLAWNTTGTQTASLPLSDDYLEIQDSSAVDWRAYDRAFPELTRNYVTEIATRFIISSVTATQDAFVYRAIQMNDAACMVDLCCFLDSDGDARIGLTTGVLDRDDPTTYITSAEVDWTESHHYRLVIDRDSDADRSKQIQVFVDYSDTAVLQAFYDDFVDPGGTAVLAFGTGDATYTASKCNVKLTFIDWFSYSKESLWRHWTPVEEGNNVVAVNTTDEFIQRPVFVNPPGITTNGSDRCCQLNVQSLTNECSISTFLTTPNALDLYKIEVDYRVDTLATAAKLIVQRASDYWYWNNGTSTWQSAASDVTLSYSPSRTRLAAVADLTGLADDQFIIKIRNDTGAGAAHNVYVYKVGVFAQ